MIRFNNTKKYPVLLAVIAFVLAGALCGCNELPYMQMFSQYVTALSQEEAQPSEAVASENQSEPALTPTDYSVRENWMLLEENPEKEVDLFYIYPTVYDDADGEDFSKVEDPAVRVLAQLVYSKTGSAIGANTNVYAPYYRQTNLSVAATKTGLEYEDYNTGIPLTDVYAALDLFFEKYNNGRPFILAGHSQGSCLIKLILGDYMKEHPEYLERMVAAYAIGFSITEDWLKEHDYVKFAERADDTGVIISWNAEGPGNAVSGTTLIVEEGAVSINPITWTRTEEKAEASENLGSRTIRMEEALKAMKEGTVTNAKELEPFWDATVPGVADAQVDLERGTVICTTSDDFNDNTAVFGVESFHSHDYDFYYNNIKENAKLRIDTFLAEHGE